MNTADNGQRAAALRWLFCFALLAVEIALLADLSTEARWLVFRTIRIPVIKFAMLGILVGLAAAAYRRRLPILPSRPGFSLAVGLHLCCVLALWATLERLFVFSLKAPVSAGMAAWFFTGVWFVTSWLNCLAPPACWPLYARKYGLFVALTLILNALTERVRDYSLSQSMVNGSIELACKSLALLGLHPVQDKSRSMLGLSGFQVEVGYHCSGWEGIALIFVFLTVYLVVRRQDLSFPSVLVILPIAVALSWILNGLRIAALLSLGAFVSSELALDAFHSRAGWVAFVFLGLVFVAAIEHFKLFHRADEEAQYFPSLPFLAPLGAQLFLTLIFAAFVVDLDIFYPARILLVMGVLGCFVGQYRRLGLWSSSELSALWWGVGVYLLWIPLVGFVPTEDPRGVLPESVANLWLISRLLGSVVVVPLVEELAFRGYLLRRIQSADFASVPPTSWTLSSAVVSSLAFGTLHQAWFAGFLAGMAYAYVYTLRGRLGDAVVAHAATNLCIAVHVVVRGRWDLWL